MRIPAWLLVAGGLFALWGVVEAVTAVVRYAPEFVEQVQDSTAAAAAGGSPFLPPA